MAARARGRVGGRKPVLTGKKRPGRCSAPTRYEGELFDALPCSDILTYVATMKRLQHYPVQVAYPGHGPTLTGEQFQSIAADYISAKENQD